MVSVKYNHFTNNEVCNSKFANDENFSIYIILRHSLFDIQWRLANLMRFFIYLGVECLYLDTSAEDIERL
jgi:hypothetical protein